MNCNNYNILALCQDEDTSAFIENSLVSQAGVQVKIFYTIKDWKKNLTKQIKNSIQPILLIALGSKTKSISPQLGSLCKKQKGLCLIWSDEEAPSSITWTLCQLLKQHGAIISNELSTLLTTAIVFKYLNTLIKEKIKIENNGLSSYLISSVDKNLLDKKGKVTIKTDTKGFFIIQSNQIKFKLQTEPKNLGKAIENIFFTSSLKSEDIEPIIDKDIISMIARPPSRVLSETASKKLLSAVGMNFPQEQLCNSANSALLYAKTIDGPVTLKLVKPNLINKEQKGVIIKNIQGASAIQKGYQQLIDLAEQMPPPKPLGILVTKYIKTTEIYWIKYEKNKKLGKILFIGKGNRTNSALTAVNLPLEQEEIISIIEKQETGTNERIKAFAETIFRFSVLIENSGSNIKSAMIYPIYISPENTSIIQDAVIEIT